MVFRKLPGVSASGMGLRLSQKFVFLLFLSGLVTLCFGALFFLPDSVRLKRIFLSKTETQPVTVGSGSENDARELLKRAKEPELPRGMTSARVETSTRLKNLSRKPTVSREATEERLAAAGKALEDFILPRSRTESASAKATSFARGAAPSEPFSYDAFKACLLKPPLGRDSGRPTDPETNARREKVKEVRRVTPAEGGGGSGSSSGAEVSPHRGVGVIVDMQQPRWLSGHMSWSFLASESRTRLCAIYVCF